MKRRRTGGVPNISEEGETGVGFEHGSPGGSQNLADSFAGSPQPKGFTRKGGRSKIFLGSKGAAPNSDEELISRHANAFQRQILKRNSKVGSKKKRGAE